MANDGFFQPVGPGGGTADTRVGHEQPGAQHGAGIFGRAIVGRTIQGGQRLADRVQRDLQARREFGAIGTERRPKERVVSMDHELR